MSLLKSAMVSVFAIESLLVLYQAQWQIRDPVGWNLGTLDLPGGEWSLKGATCVAKSGAAMPLTHVLELTRWTGVLSLVLGLAQAQSVLVPYGGTLELRDALLTRMQRVHAVGDCVQTYMCWRVSQMVGGWQPTNLASAIITVALFVVRLVWFYTRWREVRRPAQPAPKVKQS